MKGLDKLLAKAGFIPRRAMEKALAEKRTNYTMAVVVPNRDALLSMGADSPDELLRLRYPKIAAWGDNLTKSIQNQTLQKSITNAVLATFETMQSAYVAPSVSGIGPAKQMLTEWWFNPIWGQPRLVDLRTIKQLARGHVGSMAVDAVLDQIMQVDWQIVPKFRHKVDRSPTMKQEEDRQLEIVERFLKHPNRNNDSMNKILRMFGRNILETDDGTIVKVFEDYERPKVPEVQQAGTGDVRQYTAQPAWDAVPVEGAPLVEIFAEDGSSFLKQTDMHGYLMNYWQYSFIVPRRPIRFEASEIVYVMQNPIPGSPYGRSPFESVVDALKFIQQNIEYNQHFYENSAIPALQIDYPWIKGMDELKEVGQYVESNFMGPEKAFRTLITNGGTVVKTINFTPEQLQMLEMQKWYINLVLAKLKTPPSVLGIEGGNGTGGQGADQASIYRSRAIKPLISLMEDGLNTQLMPAIVGVPNELCLVELKWGAMVDIEEKERTTRIDQVNLGTGSQVINEVRLREGMAPVPWGWKPFIPGAKLYGGLTAEQIGLIQEQPQGDSGMSPGGKGFPGQDNKEAPKAHPMGSDAQQFDRPSGVSQSDTVRSMTHAGGRGPTEVSGGQFKSIQKQYEGRADTMSKAFIELMKEARDRIQDHEDATKVSKEIITRAHGLLDGLLPANSPYAQRAKDEALKDLGAVLTELIRTVQPK